VTETEWLESTELTPVLEFLRENGFASERKFRLFACARCCSIWPLFTEKVCRQAVVLSEAFADSKAEKSKIIEMEARLDELFSDAAADSNILTGPAAIRKASLRASRMAAVGEAVSDPVRPDGVSAKVVYLASEAGLTAPTEKDHCLLFHDIFGNPFRPITIDPRWLTSAVVDLATDIYQARAFDRMLILADALTDAGCDNQEIIVHCRTDELHVRGCWVVDLLLGKE